MVSLALQQALDQHDNLKSICEKYPSQATCLTQTLIDLTHASKWQHLCILDIGKNKETNSDQLGKAIIVGLRPEAIGLEAVWCCEISDMLNSAILQDIFAGIDEMNLSIKEQDKEIALLCTHFLIAVHSPDATVVYYNMARGLVKPVN